MLEIDQESGQGSSLPPSRRQHGVADGELSP
jgi:hypothetical protein